MVSLSRILTKLLLPDERASTLIFFLVSAGLELLCFLLHLLVRRSRFVLYHTARPRDSRPGCRAGYRVHHDVAAGDVHFVSLPGAAPAQSRLRSPPRRGLGLRPAGPPSFCGPRLRPSGAPRVCGLSPRGQAARSHAGGRGALWWRQRGRWGGGAESPQTGSRGSPPALCGNRCRELRTGTTRPHAVSRCWDKTHSGNEAPRWPRRFPKKWLLG